jgi:glutamate/tyrosine decarboxylase-like PLP-dependent enzyme
MFQGAFIKRRQRKMDERLYSWFLGPKAENADIFERLVLEALRDCVFWRRNFHPGDEIIITEEIRRDASFQESIDLLQQKFLTLLAELKRGVPFYSPRYIGHMLGDQLLPALIGYFAAMLHNHNNVTPEASPVTTEKERKVAEQLAKLVGYKDNAWGHITSGGTVANFEALWVARNLKYFSLGAKEVAKKLELEKIEIASPIGDTKKLAEADNWTLLNLDMDQVLEIRAKLIDSCREQNPDLLSNKKEVEKMIDNELANFTISGKGIHQFFTNFKDVKPGVVLMTATAHYSLVKVTEALGIGKRQIKKIPIDKYFSMDINELEKTLSNCLEEHEPIIALISILGSTEEGAVDYVHKITELQNEFKKKGLTFYHHCDAAWGGYIRSLFYKQDWSEVEIAGDIMGITHSWPSDEIFNSFMFIYNADSVTIDPHKLGYIPYPAGAIVFKNEKVRDLISFDAPYIFHEAEERKEEPYIGRYILEGSKPGAAAVACWLAHEIVPLNQSGYGLIIGKSLQSAQELSLKLAEDLTLKLKKDKIKLRVLTNPPDTNIICFIVNKESNRDLEEMNKLNEAIYNELKFNPNKPIQSHEFMISSTKFEYDVYGRSMKEHLQQIGISSDKFRRTGEITILRCTVKSPWLALKRGGEPDYIEEFAFLLENVIKDKVKEQFGKS